MFLVFGFWGSYNPNVDVLANIGRTAFVGSYEALHLMSGSGQGAHIAAGQAGQAFGSGHFTTGQRALGQGGHSPILQGFEQVAIQGGQAGMDDFKTYFDISGIGGHSVFNIYLDISGIGGQGGTEDFNTHFVGSGDGQGAHSFSENEELLCFKGHPQGCDFLHRLQEGSGFGV